MSGKHTSYRIKIVPSKIAADGPGLATAANIPAGEEIFCKDQTLSLSDRNHRASTCDWCLRWVGDSMSAPGRMYDAANKTPDLEKCSRCKTVRYCPNVGGFPQRPLVAIALI